MIWQCMYHNFNKDKIESYNVLEYREALIKKLKKKCATKEEFAEQLKREMMFSFFSKCEYELIISITDDGRVILSPWVGSKSPEKVATDVTDVTDFNWKSFAEKHIEVQIFKNKAKIDVWDQLSFGDNWKHFVDYCWYYRHKYQRQDPKFER